MSEISPIKLSGAWVQHVAFGGKDPEAAVALAEKDAAELSTLEAVSTIVSAAPLYILALLVPAACGREEEETGLVERLKAGIFLTPPGGYLFSSSDLLEAAGAPGADRIIELPPLDGPDVEVLIVKDLGRLNLVIEIGTNPTEIIKNTVPLPCSDGLVYMGEFTPDLTHADVNLPLRLRRFEATDNSGKFDEEGAPLKIQQDYDENTAPELGTFCAVPPLPYKVRIPKEFYTPAAGEEYGRLSLEPLKLFLDVMMDKFDPNREYQTRLYVRLRAEENE